MDPRIADEVERRLDQGRRTNVAVGVVFAVVVGALGLALSRAEAPPEDSVATASPTPTTSYPPCDGIPGSCPDGKPGWATGFTGCQVTEPDADAVESLELVPGVTARLVLPETEVAAGEKAVVLLRVTNSTGAAVRLGVATGLSSVPGAIGPGGGSAQHFGDAGGAASGQVAAGGTRDTTYELATTTCGDGPDDPEEPLAEGTYAVLLSTNVGVDGVEHPVSLKASVALT